MFVAPATNILCHWTYYEKWQRWASKSTPFSQDGEHSAEEMCYTLQGLAKLIICRGRTHRLSGETRDSKLQQTHTKKLNNGLPLTCCFQASQSEWPHKRCHAALRETEKLSSPPLSNWARRMLLSFGDVGNRLSVPPATGARNRMAAALFLRSAFALEGSVWRCSSTMKEGERNTTTRGPHL